MVVVALTVTGLIGGATTTRADEAGPANQKKIFVEMLGSSFLGANYARGLSDNLSIRVGGGLIPVVGTTALAMPTLHLNRRWRHDFQVGVGAQGLWLQDGQTQSFLSGMTAYRLRTRRGFTIRIEGAALVSPVLREKVGTVLGVTLGKTF